jgi:DNA-binding transcriptional regulator YiaG
MAAFGFLKARKIDRMPARLQHFAATSANEELGVNEVVNDVARARRGTGLSQAEFAAALSISKRTLQEWEQGRRAPSGAAQALIRIASKHPAIVRDALTHRNTTS